MSVARRQAGTNTSAEAVKCDVHRSGHAHAPPRSRYARTCFITFSDADLPLPLLRNLPTIPSKLIEKYTGKFKITA